MNNNSSKQVLLSVIGVAILVVAVVGVSFAFFSYVYNGQTANTVKTGTIVFTASDTQLKLTNVFPTTGVYGTRDNGDIVNATVSIQGSTTYEEGIDFTVKAVDVSKYQTATVKSYDGTGETTTVEIVPTVVVTPTTTTGADFTTGGTTTTYNKNNKLASNTVLCAGNIPAGTTVGKEVDGEMEPTTLLTITAYYSQNDYHISDNTHKELVDAKLLAQDYAGSIIDTATWNGLSADDANAFSFKIQVTAVEGGSANPRVQTQP